MSRGNAACPMRNAVAAVRRLRARVMSTPSAASVR